MSNKERLIANNAKIEEIRQTLAKKQVSPTDMLQARVDATNSCYYLFYNFNGTDLSFIKNLDTSNVTSFEYMFNSCSKLTSLNLSSFDTRNVKNMYSMFNGCSKLESLDLSSFDTSNVTSMYNMFAGCSALTSLDLSSFNTENVTSMSNMFYSCTGLTSLDLSSFNTENVTTMTQMFYDCSKLESLDLSSFDTRNATSMDSMFKYCFKLKNIIGVIDMIKASSINSVFVSCGELENVTLLNIKKSLTLGVSTTYGTKISNATLINTIQQLWDLTGQTSQKLTLSTTSKENIANIYVKLIDVTDEMRAEDEFIDNKKPCVVCESTDEGAMTITEYAISKNWAIA